MFDTEKNSFYKATESSSEVEKDNVTFSGNGALKFSTSGNSGAIYRYTKKKPLSCVSTCLILSDNGNRRTTATIL